ncbi:MAG: leucine-rich repeat domain-containing protein, partial [Promethearchaeota archaeon]
FLPHLKEIVLMQNDIQDIRNLEHYPELTKLVAKGGKITSMKAFENTPNIRAIDLYGNQISKIEGLEQCTKLKKLDLGSNQITKIAGLDQCCQLRRLDLSRNKITNIEGLTTLKEIVSLGLHGNRIASITGLAANENLSRVSLYEYKPFMVKNPYHFADVEGGHLFHNSGHPIFHKPNDTTKSCIGSGSIGMVLYCQWQEQPIVSLVATYAHPLAAQNWFPYLNYLLFERRTSEFIEFLRLPLDSIRHQLLTLIEFTPPLADPAVESTLLKYFLNKCMNETPKVHHTSIPAHEPYPTPFVEQFLKYAPPALQTYVLEHLQSDNPLHWAIIEAQARKRLPNSSYSLI